MGWGNRMRWSGGAAAILTLLVLLAMVGVARPVGTSARAPVTASALGEVPTTGGLRPGPVGLTPPVVRKAGVKPVAIRIAPAKVDAQVEEQPIVNGVMQNPSGPFVVSWYKETGKLGEADNVVMAGHLDYWDVGQAVFFHLGELKQSDVIEVTGSDGQVYRYAVDWVKNYKLADLGPTGVQQIVGKTSSEKLTLITCGGPFDYNKGEYLDRMVVRASRTA